MSITRRMTEMMDNPFGLSAVGQSVLSLRRVCSRSSGDVEWARWSADLSSWALRVGLDAACPA
jgi:hypothetical protein